MREGTEQIYSRDSYDSRFSVEVVDVKYKRNMLARCFFVGEELAHRWYGYEFPDVQPRGLAMDKAVAWCMGAMEFYNEAVECGIGPAEEYEWGTSLLG